MLLVSGEGLLHACISSFTVIARSYYWAIASKAMRMKVSDLRSIDFQFACGIFSLFIIHLFFAGVPHSNLNLLFSLQNFFKFPQHFPGCPKYMTFQTSFCAYAVHTYFLCFIQTYIIKPIKNDEMMF